MTLSKRIAKLETTFDPPKHIVFKTVEGKPVDVLELIWRTEPFCREENETVADFIGRCKQWAHDHYHKGFGMPAMFLQYPHF
jgi:hypothetical protein